jgi:hypothetical protein
MSLNNPPKRIVIAQTSDVPLMDTLALQSRYPDVVRVLNVSTAAVKYDYIFQKASEEPVAIVAIINYSLVLYDSFYSSMAYLYKRFDNFLMVGSRYNRVPPATVDYQNPNWKNVLLSNYLSTGRLSTFGGCDYFVWNTNHNVSSLLHPVGTRIPPFLYGRPYADDWIIKHAIQNERIAVVDTTKAVIALDFHQNNNNSNIKNVSIPMATRHSSGGKVRKTFPFDEIFFNKYLAFHAGDYIPQDAYPRHAPWALLKCAHPPAGGSNFRIKSAGSQSYSTRHQLSQLSHPHYHRRRLSVTSPDYVPSKAISEVPPVSSEGNSSDLIPLDLCLKRRMQTHHCTCNYSIYSKTTHSDPSHANRRICTNSVKQCERAQTRYSGLQKHVLKVLTRYQKSYDNIIIMTGFTDGFTDMALNLWCMLTRLEIRNFLFVALHENAMAMCRLHSLPCYGLSSTVSILPDQNIMYGTADFKRVTHSKSHAVLSVLETGAHVLWTDIDIFWKSNAMNDMMATRWRMNPNVFPDIVIQTNARPGEKLNFKERLNSGFYLVRNSNKTINAFQNIIQRIPKYNWSEQPHFWHVLCGKKGVYAKGDDMCYNPLLGVKVQILDRYKYPNGAMTITNTTHSAVEDGVIAVHYNWRVGGITKQLALESGGGWLLDSNGGCKLAKS